MPGSGLSAPLLNERYRPETLIGRGGTSAVYSGTDVVLGRRVAIKLLSAKAAADETQYRGELRILSSLNHHGIVSIIDAGIDRSSPDDLRPFIVMEFVQGETLRQALLKRTFTSRQIGEIAYDIAEALEYVHLKAIVHRDITPANILLVDYGTKTSRVRAQLTDFGIAMETDHVPVSSGATTGTAAYLSPEQARNTTLATPSDIYSLGLVLLECFTHELAFPGTPVDSAIARLRQPPAIPPTIPAPWRSLIKRMTHPAPSERPNAETVAAVARAIIIDDETDRNG